jgi:hypothetical protein
MSNFVDRPSVRVRRLFDLLFVAFWRLPLDTIDQGRLVLSFDFLTDTRCLYIEISWVTIETEVLEVLRQRTFFILWIVTQLVLPPVTFVACDRRTIIIEKAAYTAYLAIILLRSIQRRRAMPWVLYDGSGKGERGRRVSVTGDSGDRI